MKRPAAPLVQSPGEPVAKPHDLEPLLDASPQALLVVAGGGPVFANAALAALVGATDAPAALRSAAAWSLTACVEQPPASAGTPPRTLSLGCADGAVRPFDVLVTPQIWHGEPAWQIALWPAAASAVPTPLGAERALLEAIDRLADAIALFDANDRLLMCNAAYVESFVSDGDAGSALGQPFHALTTANVRRHMRGTRGEQDRFVALRRAWHREASGVPLQMPLVDGRWMMVRDFRTAGDGRMVVLSDITELRSSQDALHALDERLRDFVDVAADWFWETDAEHRFTYLSQRFEEMTGQPTEAFIGHTRQEATGAPHSRVDFDELDARLALREAFRDFVYSRAGENGERRYFRISGKPVLDRDGRFLGYRGSGSDVTISATAAADLRTAQTRLLDALEASADAVALFDAEGLLVASNSAYQHWFQGDAELRRPGVTFEVLLRASIRDGVLAGRPRDEAWVQDRLHLHRQGGGQFVETHRADGRWTQARDFRTAEGGTLVVVRDITALKEREQALRDSEQRFRAFARASGDAFWETDPQGRLVYLSAHGELARIRDSFLLGQRFQDLAAGRADTPRWRALERAFEAGAPVEDFRVPLRTSGGELRHLSISGRAVIAANGTLGGYRGVARDVTTRRRTEQIMRLLADAASAMDLQQLMRAGVRALAELFEVRYAMVGLLDEESGQVVTTRAMWAGDHFAENFSYPLAGSPCGDVLDHEVTLIHEGVVQRYPHDRGLAALGVQSYLGTALLGTDGRMLGILSLMDVEPLYPPAPISPLPEVVAGRFAAEVERERAQRDLRRSERSLRSVFEHAPVVLALKDREGRYQRVSPPYERVFGIPPSAVIGRRPSEVLPAEASARVEARDRAVLEHGQPSHHELHVLVEDSRRTFLVQRFPLPGDDDGIAGVGIAATDVTELKAAQERLNDAYALLRTAVNSIREGFALFDQSGCLVMVNEQHRRLHAVVADLLEPGTPRRRLLEATVERGGITEPNGSAAQAFVERRLRAVEDGLVTEYLSSAGRWLELHDSRTPQGQVIVMTLDVTARKTSEQALASYRDQLEHMVAERTRALETAQSELVKSERLATIGRLAATVSHELRNPLGAVRNALFLLRRRTDAADARIVRYLDIIERELHHSERIIGDLLETTRVKQPHLETLHLGAMVAALAADLRLPPAVRIGCDATAAAFTVHADAVQLRQVLANLFTNAAQAMDFAGEVRVEAHRAQGEARIRVRDSGPGVAAELGERIFEPLFTTRSKGNGLGLWISREIVRRHGGELALCPSAAGGACFELRLPLADSVDTPAAPGSPAHDRTDGAP